MTGLAVFVAVCVLARAIRHRRRVQRRAGAELARRRGGWSYQRVCDGYELDRNKTPAGW